MAGIIKSHLQLGDSATATQNFMVTAQAADGTMKIARGNNGATTQDIITVAADGSASFPNSPASNSKYYQSVETSYTVSTTNTFAHGLGTMPKLVRVTYKCITAESGFAIGDEVEMNAYYSAGYGAVTVSSNATNIYVTNSQVGVISRATNGPFQLTISNWKIIVRAWA